MSLPTKKQREQIKEVHHSFFSDADTPVKEVDESFFSGEKKNLGGNELNNSGTTSSPIKSLEDDSQIPLVDLSSPNTENSIDLAAKHNELANAKEYLGLGLGGEVEDVGKKVKVDGREGNNYVNKGGTSEAKDLKEYLKIERGINDPEQLYQETKGLTPTDYGKEGLDKDTLLTDREKNNHIYQRK